MKMKVGVFIVAGVTGIGLGCSSKKKKSQKSEVASQVEPAPLPVSAPAESLPERITAPSVKIEGGIYLSNEQIKDLLKEEFLYTANVQYAEMKDEELGFETQQVLSQGSLKIGRFKLSDLKLQFIVDESRGVESDFPVSKVYLDFDILGKDDTGLRLKLVNVAGGASQAWQVGNNSERWLRSLEYFSNDKTLVWETSLVARGKDDQLSVNHFAESIMPRGRFADSSKALIKQDEPKAPVDDSFLNVLSRVGTFDVEGFVKPQLATEWNDQVVKVKRVTSTRYDISEGKTIDWYVTDNLPDQLYSDIKAGVEGWNRYYNTFRGDSVVRFLGKLPQGVKLGDPRYNVVRFDAVSAAGAAYESQNFDPETGIQTQSMIYMPFAWYNLGNRDFVDTLREAELPSGTEGFAISRHKHISCKRDINFQSESMAMMLERSLTPEQAGRALMRSTLLHEVGHALGMDHNFRGSTSGNLAQRTSKAWKYSNSVMDYNVPMIEDVELYSDLEPNGEVKDPVKGKMLDYDFQFIDIVYNQAKQVIAKPDMNKTVGFCNDQDADDLVNGVSPTCIRYDIFSNPEESVRFIQSRLSPTMERTLEEEGSYLTLAGAMKAVERQGIKDLAKANGANASKKELLALLKTSVQKLLLSERLFFVSGHGSMRNVLRGLLPLLGEWKSLPEGLEKNSDESKLSSWDVLPVFDMEGISSEELYVKYQEKVKTAILHELLTSLDIDGNKRTRSGRALIMTTFKTLLEEANARKLLSAEEQAALEASLFERQELLEKTLLDSSVALFNAVPKMIASETGNINFRANLPATLLLKVFSKYDLLVADPKVDTATKLNLVLSFATDKQSRRAGWDKASETEQYLNIQKSMMTSIQMAFSELDQKLKSTGYLTEEARADHENLGTAIEALK
jgi:hypothetical protein